MPREPALAGRVLRSPDERMVPVALVARPALAERGRRRPPPHEAQHADRKHERHADDEGIAHMNPSPVALFGGGAVENGVDDQCQKKKIKNLVNLNFRRNEAGRA